MDLHKRNIVSTSFQLVNEGKDSNHYQYLCLAIYEANGAGRNLPSWPSMWEFYVHRFSWDISSKKLTEVLAELAVLRVVSGWL